MERRMERRSQGARDRRAPTGGAGDASRRKLIGELGCTAQLCDAANAGRIAAPITRRLMRVHFGDRPAEFITSMATRRCVCHKS